MDTNTGDRGPFLRDHLPYNKPEPTGILGPDGIVTWQDKQLPMVSVVGEEITIREDLVKYQGPNDGGSGGQGWNLEPNAIEALEHLYPDASWTESLKLMVDELGGSQYDKDYDPEEVARIMVSFAYLVVLKARWWVEGLGEDIESLLPQCLHTAMIWERG